MQLPPSNVAKLAKLRPLPEAVVTVLCTPDDGHVGGRQLHKKYDQYIWGIACMVLKLGHFEKIGRKYLEIFETWRWRRAENIG